MLTLKAKVIAAEQTQAVLVDAMYCATKVYNGLIWHLRDEFERTGKTQATRKNLNAALKTLPRANGYYSLSAQATRDEVIQAYKSFFALRQAGRTEHRMPGFRRKTDYSPLRYYQGFGFTLEGDQLHLSLGTRRQDGVRSVSVILQMRPDVFFQRVRGVLLTYDKTHGLYAHLVVEIAAKEPLGDRRVAVDLGETQAITAIFDDGATLMYSGRLIKSIRRYWNKVRAKVKPPTAENKRKSRRFRQVERKESRQVQADVNAAANIFQKAFKVSPLIERSSGRVARPVVLPIRLGWHTVHETKSKVALAA
ncbi:MAG: nuclease/transposase family protein [Symbiobacteriia bacterium]